MPQCNTMTPWTNPTKCLSTKQYTLHECVRRNPTFDYTSNLCDATGKVHDVTSDDGKQTMRHLASKVYNITNKEELNKWPSHSLRVGACRILWAKGHSAEFTQRVLQWKSESLKDCTRDLLVHSQQHNETMADVWEVPIF